MTECKLTCGQWTDNYDLPYTDWNSDLHNKCCIDKRYSPTSKCPYDDQLCLHKDPVDCSWSNMIAYCSESNNADKDICKCYSFWGTKGDTGVYDCLSATKCKGGYNPGNDGSMTESFHGERGCHKKKSTFFDNGCFWFLVVVLVIMVVCIYAFRCTCDKYLHIKKAQV